MFCMWKKLCDFGVNLRNLWCFFCKWMVPVFGCISVDLGSVSDWENCMQIPFLSAHFVALLLQHTLNASIVFANCNLSDPIVLVAGKSCSWTEVLQNTGSHIDQKQYLKHSRIYFCVFAANPTCPLSLVTSSHTQKSIRSIIAIFPLRWCQHSQKSRMLCTTFSSCTTLYYYDIFRSGPRNMKNTYWNGGIASSN